MSNCIFCKIIAGDASAKLFYQNDNILIFEDIKPAAKFHLLAVPKEHILNVKSLSKDHVDLVNELVRKSKEVLAEKGADLNDLIMGFHLPPFNSVSHLHLHAISPASSMSFLGRQIFKPDSFWFAKVETILENINTNSKL